MMINIQEYPEFILKNNTLFWCGDFKYRDRCYENLIDSNGKSHSVEVGCNTYEGVITHEMYELNDISDRVLYRLDYNNQSFHLTNLSFQYNLDIYRCVYPRNKYTSPFNLVSAIIRDSETTEWNRINRHWRLSELKYAFPIYETNFISGNNTVIDRPITDKYFFNYEDRISAMDNINHVASKRLKDLEYDKMNSRQLVDFMNKRFQEKILIKGRYPEIFM